jgi:hypothetical protein
VERERQMIDVTARSGGEYCRVLSGQRRDESRARTACAGRSECITSLLDTRPRAGVVLNMENHYKDGYWRQPEFAQKLDVFLEVIGGIDSPWFGVNFDPPTRSWPATIPWPCWPRSRSAW